MSIELSVRIDPDNPDHHLWCNHGTWWIHYTLLFPGGRRRRVRRSLRTRCREEARRLRDLCFSQFGVSPGGAA